MLNALGGIYLKEVVLTMKEAQKYKVIKRVAEGRSSRARACITLKLSDRQVRRVARHAIPAANIQNNPAEFASFPPIFFAL